jgi:hypothetical protein
MADLLRIPVVRRAIELFEAFQQESADWPRDEPVADDLLTNCTIVLAQAIYAIVLPDAGARKQAQEELRRATRRLAILIDVAHARSRLSDRGARELRIRVGRVWYEMRLCGRARRLPRPRPQARAKTPLDWSENEITTPDALPPDELRPLVPTRMLGEASGPRR